jgi:hypothetical protein
MDRKLSPSENSNPIIIGANIDRKLSCIYSFDIVIAEPVISNEFYIYLPQKKQKRIPGKVFYFILFWIEIQCIFSIALTAVGIFYLDSPSDSEG